MQTMLLIGAGFSLFMMLLCGTAMAKIESISIWKRQFGRHDQGAQLQGLDQVQRKLSEAKTQTQKVFDIQYGKQQTYKLLALRELLPLPRPSGVDTVLLHGQNRMLIPIPLAVIDDPQSQLKIWLALAVQQAGKWTNDFPVVSKKSTMWRDPRPIAFAGNKLVVSSEWYPQKPESAKSSFSPFLFMNSLVAIEFVHYDAWLRQFAVSEDPKVRHGLEVFAGRCQFCHGAWELGAGWGWDFVTPLKIYEKRSASSLQSHVIYQKNHALEKGLMMPQQADLSETEAQDLWLWLKAIAEQPPKAYQ